VPKLKFLRFLVIGVVNTVFGYALFALLIWSNIPYPIAIGLATACGIAFNFQTTGKLVFDGAPRQRLGRFVSVYFFIYCINVGSLNLLLAKELNIYVANALLIIPLAILSYLLQQKFVFKST
jgi:putative flippase GtrA